MKQANGCKCSFQLSSFSESLLNEQHLFICSVVTAGAVMCTYKITYFVNLCGVSVIFHREIMGFNGFVELVY